MIIVADESVDFAIVEALRDDGFEVIAITHHSPGISDDEVLNLAVKLNALLITEDKDFGELVNRLGMEHKGIVLIRLIKMEREEKVNIAIRAFKNNIHLFPDAFSVIDKHKLRIRKIEPLK